MRTVGISKKTIAVVGTFLLVAIVFFASLIPSSQPAQAADLLPLPTVTVSVPILPPVTVRPPAIVRTVTQVVKDVTVVTRTLPGSRVTVTEVLPRATQTVTLPGRVVTQPAQTVTVNSPATPQAVTTITVTQTGQIGQRTVTLPPVRETTTVSKAGGVTTTTVTKEKPVVITRIQAVLSAIGLAILGALIGMLVLGAYRLGWFRGDAGNREFIEDTVDDLKHNK